MADPIPGSFDLEKKADRKALAKWQLAAVLPSLEKALEIAYEVFAEEADNDAGSEWWLNSTDGALELAYDGWNTANEELLGAGINLAVGFLLAGYLEIGILLEPELEESLRKAMTDV